MASLSYPEMYKGLSWYLNNVKKLHTLLNSILSNNNDETVKEKFLAPGTDYLSFAFHIYMDGMYAKQTLFFSNFASQLIFKTNDMLEIKRIIHQVSHCTIDVVNEIPLNRSSQQPYYRTIVFQVESTFVVFHPQAKQGSKRAWVYGGLTTNVENFISKLVGLQLIILDENDPLSIYNIGTKGIHPFYHFALLNSLCDISVVTKEPAALDNLMIHNIQTPNATIFLEQLYDFVQSFLARTKQSIGYFDYCTKRLHKLFRITQSSKVSEQETIQNKLINYLNTSFFLQKNSQAVSTTKVAISTEHEKSIKHLNEQTIVSLNQKRVSLVSDLVTGYCEAIMIGDKVKVDNLNLYINEIDNQILLFNICNNTDLSKSSMYGSVTYTASSHMSQVKERKLITNKQKYKTVFTFKASQLFDNKYIKVVQDYKFNNIDEIDIAILSQTPKAILKILGASDINFVLNQKTTHYMIFSPNKIRTDLERSKHVINTDFISLIAEKNPKQISLPYVRRFHYKSSKNNF